MSDDIHTGKPSAQDVIELIRAEGIVESNHGIGAGDNLFEAGLDSMAIMQVLVAVAERFGVMLEAGDVTKEHFGTAEALARLIGERVVHS